MQLFDREPLFLPLRRMGADDWVDILEKRCQRAFCPSSHGSLAQWIDAWKQLPDAGRTLIDAAEAAVTVRRIEPPAQLSPVQQKELAQVLHRFHPWRKGPFEILGVPIDTEWRSSWKWDRLAPHLNLHDQLVLDVGCGNGYYGWRMLHAGARLVCGLDPMLLFVMQYEVLRRYAVGETGEAGCAGNYVLPVGDEVLSMPVRLFDTVFSMGVLYHRSSPIDHLQALNAALRSGGRLILETLIIDEAGETVLVPQDRYAKMRNVWFIASVSMLLRWLQRTGFQRCEVLDMTTTTVDEQRRTDWMRFESLADFLDPDDPQRTVEGYPAPRRAILSAYAG